MGLERIVRGIAFPVVIASSSGCATLAQNGDSSVFAGAEVLSMSNVQGPLEKAGYQTPQPTSFVIGGAQDANVDSIVLGLSGAYFSGGAVSGPSQGPAVLQSDYHGWWLTADLGAALIDYGGIIDTNDTTFALWPVATIGGYSFGMDVFQSESFSTALTTIPTGIGTSESGLLLGIALPIKLRARVGHGGGFVFGLRPGFTYGAQIGGWSGVSNGPSMGLLGGYVTASIGIASF